jgi:uncharacterized protein YjiS (DUF1127 family)
MCNQHSFIRRYDMTRVHQNAAIGATFSSSLAQMAFRAVKRVVTALKNRRQVTRLASLDDRCLKDIGLVRSDVDAALSTSVLQDPSHHLCDVTGHQVAKNAGVSLSRAEYNRLRRNDAVVTNPKLGFAKS